MTHTIKEALRPGSISCSITHSCFHVFSNFQCLFFFSHFQLMTQPQFPWVNRSSQKTIFTPFHPTYQYLYIFLFLASRTPFFLGSSADFWLATFPFPPRSTSQSMEVQSYSCPVHLIQNHLWFFSFFHIPHSIQLQILSVTSSKYI